MSNGGRRTKSSSKHQPSPQQKKPPPEKRGPRQKRKSDKRKKRIMAGLALFIGSCVLELIVSCMGNITFVLTTVGPLLTGVVVAVSEDLFKPSKDDERPGKGKPDKEVFLTGDSRMMQERHAVVSFSYLLYSGDKSISPMKV